MKKLTLLILSFILPCSLMSMDTNLDPENTVPSTFQTDEHVDEPVTWSYNAFCKACENKNEKLALQLLEIATQENINDDPKEPSPLHLAIIYKLESTALKLMEMGADTTKKYLRFAPFQEALLYKQLNVAYKMIELEKVDIDENLIGSTLLHCCCENKNTGLALKLIEAGANIDTKNRAGKTPMFLACKHALRPVAKALLDKGVPLIYGYQIQRLAGDYAWKHNWEDLYCTAIEKDLIIRPKADKKICRTLIFFEVCREEKEKIALALIKKGIDINWKSGYGKTPLSTALEHNMNDAALKLFQLGAEDSSQHPEQLQKLAIKK